MEDPIIEPGNAYDVDTPLAPVPRCEVCKRQDDTVRLVSYPFVFSLVVVTFRRAFSGLYCARHQRLYLLLASAITSVAGWIGIPFGFIFTPAALLTLAKGGELPGPENARLLRLLADHRLRKGDTAGAVRCLEASLSFSDLPAVRDQLAHLYGGLEMRGAAAAAGGNVLAQLILPALFVLIAGAAGLLVGFIDYHFITLVFGNIPNETSILVAILTWVPMVMMGVMAAVLLRLLLSRIMARVRLTSNLLSVGWAAAAAALAAYGIPGGRSLAGYFEALSSFGGLSTGQMLSTLVAVILRGGLLELRTLFADGTTSSLIYIILLIAIFFYILFTLQNFASRQADLNSRLAALGRPAVTAAPAAASLAGVILVLALGWFAIPQKTTVDYLEAAYAFVSGMSAEQETNNFSAGMADLKKAVDLAPSIAIFHEELGWVYWMQGDAQSAEAELLEALRLDPQMMLAHQALSQIYYTSGRYDQAEAEVRANIDAYPEDASVWIDLGYLYSEMGKSEESLQAFETARRLDPQNLNAYLGPADLYQTQEDYPKALEILQQAAGHFPQNSQPYTQMGWLSMTMNLPDSAVSQFNKAVEINNQDFGARMGLGMAQSLIGEHEQALQSFQKAEYLNTAMGLPHSLIASEYYELGQLEKAEKELKQAAESELIESSSLLYYAQALTRMRRFEQAQAVLEEVLADGDVKGRVSLQLAEVYTRLEKYDQAFAAVEQAEAGGAEPYDILYARSGIYLLQNNFEQAEKILKDAAAVRPEFSAVHSDLGLIYLQQGRLDEAGRELKLALQADSYSSAAHRNQALLYWKQGRAEEALKEAEQSIKLIPSSDLAYFVKGMVLLEAGQKAEAQTALETFKAHYLNRAYARSYLEQAEQALAELSK